MSQWTIVTDDGFGRRFVRDMSGIGDACTLDRTQAIRCSSESDAQTLAMWFAQRNGVRAWAEPR